MRQQQSCKVGEEGGGKEYEPPDAKQSQAHDGVANQDEQEGLNERYACHEDDFRPDIAAIGELQELFAFQQGTVFDNLFCAAAHTDESGHDDSHKEIAHQILVIHDGVTLWWGITGEQGTDHRQHRGFQERNTEVLDIGDLRLEVSTQEDQELPELARFLQIGGRHFADVRLRKFWLMLQIEFMPLLWRHLSGFRGFTCIVDCFLVDDVQHNLRIDIATGGAGTRLCVGVVGCALEIGDGIDGIAVEDGISALVQQPQTVEELVDITGGLMDVHHHQLALVGLLLQEVDDLFCISR